MWVDPFSSIAIYFLVFSILSAPPPTPLSFYPVIKPLKEYIVWYQAGIRSETSFSPLYNRLSEIGWYLFEIRYWYKNPIRFVDFEKVVLQRRFMERFANSLHNYGYSAFALALREVVWCSKPGFFSRHFFSQWGIFLFGAKRFNGHYVSPWPALNLFLAKTGVLVLLPVSTTTFSFWFLFWCLIFFLFLLYAVWKMFYLFFFFMLYGWAIFVFMLSRMIWDFYLTLKHLLLWAVKFLWSLYD